MTDNIILIYKSQISKLDFSGNDPLQSETSKKQRIRKLKKAVKLNATSPRLFSILVKDKSRGLFKFRSAILAVSKEYVTLKGNIPLPIACIKDVLLI